MPFKFVVYIFCFVAMKKKAENAESKERHLIYLFLSLFSFISSALSKHMKRCLFSHSLNLSANTDATLLICKRRANDERQPLSLSFSLHRGSFFPCRSHLMGIAMQSTQISLDRHFSLYFCFFHFFNNKILTRFTHPCMSTSRPERGKSEMMICFCCCICPSSVT